MNSRNFKKLIIFSILVYTVTVYAADYYNLASGNNQEITEHTVCSKVTNNSGKSIFIPTKTSNEWTSFRNSTAVGTIVKEACAGGLCDSGPDDLNCYSYGTSGTCNAEAGCTWNGASCVTDCTDFGTETPCSDTRGCYWDTGTCYERCSEFNDRPISAESNCMVTSTCSWSGSICFGIYQAPGCGDPTNGCTVGDCSCYMDQPSCDGDSSGNCSWDGGVCASGI